MKLREIVDRVNTVVHAVVSWVNGLRPVRVFAHFEASGGSTLTGSMSYQSIFAVFAALWVTFSVAGLWLNAHPELLNALYGIINQSIPNLIGEDGIVNPSDLLNASALSWSAAIALVGLLSTALGWMSITARAIRTIFAMPKDTTFFLLIKLRELGLGVLFGLILLVSAGLTVVSTQALHFVFSELHLPNESFWFDTAARVIGLTIVLAIDMLTLAGLYRLLSQVRIPGRRLFAGALLGAIGLGALKVLGSALLGGASKNPLLAAFAVIIGLLIWFNLTSMVVLLAASWIAIGMTDAGLSPQMRSAAELEALTRRREDDAMRLSAEVELRNARDARADAPWYRHWAADRRVRAAEKGARRHGVTGPN